MKVVRTTSEWTKTGQKIFVVGVIALLMTSAAPTASADRATGAETEGIYHGYRMVDDTEPDGPCHYCYSWLLDDHEGEFPGWSGSRLTLPLPFPVYGCENENVWVGEGGLFFPCGDSLTVDVEAPDNIIYAVGTGLDARAMVANLIWLVGQGGSGWGFVVTLAVDGTVEMHEAHHPNSFDGTAVWNTDLFSESIAWDTTERRGAARWEPYGTLEHAQDPPIPDDVELLIPATSIPVAPGGVSTPGVPPLTIDPVGTDPIPVGTPDVYVPETCTPGVPVLCIGPFTVPGQDFGEVPGVGPTDPVTTPGVPPMSVPLPVDLEVGFTDIEVFASSDVPEPGEWHGPTIMVPVPIIDEDVPVAICPDGCPFPVLPKHEVHGSVFVRGTVDGTPVDQTVPIEASGGPEE